MQARQTTNPEIQSTTRVEPRLFDPNAITVAEIHESRDVLLALKLSSELVALVLNFAEYWCVERFKLSVPLSMAVHLAQCRPPGTGERFSLKEASSLYLQTGPIGRGDGLDALQVVNPKKVIFRIVSRDEGENYEVGRVGTYLNGASWIDASIIREDETWTGSQQQEPIMALMASAPADVLQNMDSYERGQGVPWYLGDNPFEIPPWFCHDSDRTRLKGGFKLVSHSDRLMWLLQRNRVSCFDFADKRIEWTENVCRDYKQVGKRWWIDSPGDNYSHELDQEPKNAHGRRNRDWMPPIAMWQLTHWRNGVSTVNEEAKDEEWPTNGSGSGVNFVASFQRGDRIGIWARTLASCFGS